VIGELLHRGATVTRVTGVTRRTPKGFSAPSQVPSGRRVQWHKVVRDEDGYLYFVPPATEMIKTKGFRVSPTEVEARWSPPGHCRRVDCVAQHRRGGTSPVPIHPKRPAAPEDSLRQYLKSHLRVTWFRVCHSLRPVFLLPVIRKAGSQNDKQAAANVWA